MPKFTAWSIMEQLIFGELEREIISQLEQMVYAEHLAMLTVTYDNDFEQVRRATRNAYSRTGKLIAPWFKWQPARTIADMWQSELERRKDPEYMSMLLALQAELDAKAAKYKAETDVRLSMKRSIKNKD